MNKRKQNAALWSKDVALSFRSVMEAYQQATLAVPTTAAAPPVPPARPSGAGAAGAGHTANGGHDGKGAAASASAAAHGAAGDVATCHERLRGFFDVFYHADQSLAADAVSHATDELRKNKENRKWSIVGNGPTHVLYVMRRAIEATGPNAEALAKFRRDTTRLVALCALHDETETVFFNNGAVELAMTMGRTAKSTEVKGHAARLFFNLCYIRSNRPGFLRKGALDHIAYVVSAALPGSAADGTERKMVLSMSKALVQLACHPNCIKPMIIHPKFLTTWMACAQHAFGDIRQRAAVVFSQCHESNLGLDTRFKPIVARMANEVLHGAMSGDTSNAKVATAMAQADMFAKQTSGQAPVSVAPPFPPVRTPTPSDSCDAKFMPYFRKFTDANLQVAKQAVADCLTKLRGHKNWRPDICKGNGVDLIIYAARRAEPSGPNPSNDMCLSGIRLIAEAALHDDTEDNFFQAGAFELATHVARVAPSLDIKQHAARLAFNLTYLRSNRPGAIAKGALDHIARMVLDTTGDATSGPTQAIVLSTAKMCVQLACHGDCVEPLFTYHKFRDIWLRLARHSSPDVRQRAAAVFSKVAALNIGGAAEHRARIEYMINEVRHGRISTDTSSQAVSAQKTALTVTADLPDVDVSTCDPMFQECFRGFYASSPEVVEGSAETALSTIQAAKARRPLACKGSGLLHMMKLLREAPNGSSTQLTAVRLCAEAGLHDETEDLFFRAGGVEEAMRIAKSTSNDTTRQHATRFFFNMSYIRHNRAAFASKGAVDFMHHVIKNFGAPGQPHATAMVLHMAKTMVQLVCVPDAVSTVAEHPKFMECWNVFSMHDDQQVRLRAAKILNKVLPASNAMGLNYGFVPKYAPMLLAVTSGKLSRDDNATISTAKSTAQTYMS